MREDEFQALVKGTIQDAKNYMHSSELTHDRELATDYYKGRLPDVDKDAAEEDRSKVVLTEVRDAVLGMMPDLLRMFFSSDCVVKYKPIVPQEEQDAKDATDYIWHVVLQQDNDWFRTFYDSLQDTLVRKTGFLHWYLEESEAPVYVNYTGITEMQIALLQQENPELEIIEQRSYPGPTDVYHDIKTRTVKKHNKIRVVAKPNEEVFVSPRSRSMTYCPAIGFSTTKTVSELVEMGYDFNEVKDLDDSQETLTDQEREARLPGRGMGVEDEKPADPSLKPIMYTELYMNVDFDGDNIAELRKICCGGTGYEVLYHEPVDEIPIADLCGYIEAHSFFGSSVADLVMDIQRISSRIMRDTLDSLAQSIRPRTGVVDGQVNLDDVLNPDTSNIIRMRQPGMVQDLKTDFVGRDGLPLIEKFREIGNSRTGISDASQGLDPDVLQSTTQTAVNATLTRAQARIEMVARTLVETGFKRLFKGLLKMVVRHQDQPRQVQIKGKWKEYKPSGWNPEMEVEVDFPLGRGTQVEQIMFLTNIASKQEQILSTLGPENPLTTTDQYANTLHRIVELGGYRNTEAFFLDPNSMPPEQKQAKMQGAAAFVQSQQAPAATGPAAPDPQIEMAKIQANMQIEQAKIELEREKMAAQMQLEQAKLMSQMEVSLFEAKLKYQQTMEVSAMDAMSQAASDKVKAQTSVAVALLKPKGGDGKSSGQSNTKAD